jgi:hypothetical protein
MLPLWISQFDPKRAFALAQQVGSNADEAAVRANLFDAVGCLRKQFETTASLILAPKQTTVIAEWTHPRLISALVVAILSQKDPSRKFRRFIVE